MSKPTTVDEYIENSPQEAKEMLLEIQKILKEVAPHATDAIKWGVPVLEGKRILFSYSATKNHVTFMPTHQSLAPFTKELEGYQTGQDTIQFPYGKPLPKELIRKIAEHRVKDVEDNDARWMY